MDNYADPAESYVKLRRQPQASPTPSHETMRKGAVPWPAEVPVPIESVTAVELTGAQRRVAAEAGQQVKELDLNGDGKNEAIVGTLGQWHTGSVQIPDSQGNRLLSLNESLPPTTRGRVDLVTVAGIPNPVLVKQAGRPRRDHGQSGRLLLRHPLPDLVEGTSVVQCPAK